jgi:thioredoxin reductase (NADPH)
MIETDALIIGAGPVGLFQVFELGLLGIQAHVVDALPHSGGQCIELYADKPIYDIPALPVCTGRQLIERLQQQIKPFNPCFYLGQEVASLRRLGDQRFHIETSTGTRFLTKTVFVAAGVGAFLPRKLQVPGLEPWVGKKLFYRAPDKSLMAGHHVLILGEDNEAIELAVDLAESSYSAPQTVTLMHRRDSFKADDHWVARMRELCKAGRMKFVVGQILGHEQVTEQITTITYMDENAQTQSLRTDILVALLGLSPRLGPVAQWGLALERKQLQVSTEDFSSSEAGIFAVGDINTYPGKKKLIVCGFHECTLAAFGAAAYLHPGKVIPLQYTTASPKLHRLLGV